MCDGRPQGTVTVLSFGPDSTSSRYAPSPKSAATQDEISLPVAKQGRRRLRHVC